MSVRRIIPAYAAATAAATFLLLVAGGLVTSTDSGLAVPDWPLSYGMLFPPMVGGILFEHGHRMIAGFVGLLILGLTVCVGKAEPRPWVRRISYLALGAVVVQALLGGLTVLLMLPPQISIAHAVLGQTLFCLVVCLAWAVSGRWQEEPAPMVGGGRPSLPWLAAGAAVAAACQLVLGAVVRHTGYAVFHHIGGAIVLLALVVWCRMRVSQPDGRAAALHGHAQRALILVLMQVLLGAGLFMHRGSISFRTFHHGLGALVLAQAVVLAWETCRRTQPAARAAGAGVALDPS
jgi:cytochrome c oxidase assembly protein subunit 15